MEALFDIKTRNLKQSLDEAICSQEEIEECGDLEERLEAAQAVADAEYRLSRHLLSDQQEDKEPESK